MLSDRSCRRGIGGRCGIDRRMIQIQPTRHDRAGGQVASHIDRCTGHIENPVDAQYQRNPGGWNAKVVDDCSEDHDADAGRARCADRSAHRRCREQSEFRIPQINAEKLGKKDCGNNLVKRRAVHIDCRPTEQRTG